MPGRFHSIVRRLCAMALAAVCAGAAAQSASAPPAPLDAGLREQVVMVPKGSGLLSTSLETTFFRPPGQGPFPIVVINHGKQHGNPRFQARARYEPAVRTFLSRGYMVVIPMRQGFSQSTGAYIGGGCNTEGNGLAQAEDVQTVLAYLRTVPDADNSRIVIAGQSHGGLTTMALSSLPPAQGVKGYINFAGGLNNDNCVDWEGALAGAMGAYGKTARLPSLWFYGSNDSYWPEALWRDMYARYVAGGAPARLVAYGPFASDAHGMFASRAGLKIWVPEVDKFLAQLGLPSQVSVALPGLQHDHAPPAATDAFPVSDAAAIPHVGDAAREGYRKFLATPFPRAFAIAETGAWAYVYDRADAMNAAMERCTRNAQAKGGTCHLYAVDDQIVWPKP